MFYSSQLRQCRDPEYVADRLLALRAFLSGEHGVPSKSPDNLLLATWNIREFDSNAYGPRTPEAFLYIAEIIDRFDLVAVQEVREDLEALDRVRDLLGSWWDYVVTDVTEGKPGNRERLAFLYDKRKVRFDGVAGEVVIPPREVKTDSGKTVYHPSDQLYRSPFLVAFKAGWRKFMLCTVHILYGKSQANDPKRVEEIRLIAEFLAKRAKEKSSYSDSMILLGDFNIFDRTDDTMKVMTGAGFEVPEALKSIPGTNVPKSKHYDQIALLPARRKMQATGNAGVIDFFEVVFRDEDMAHYRPDIGDKAWTSTSNGTPRDDRSRLKYFRTYWRTHQMSDHLPMWCEFKIDFADEYLRRVAGTGA